MQFPLQLRVWPLPHAVRDRPTIAARLGRRRKRIVKALRILRAQIDPVLVLGFVAWTALVYVIVQDAMT